MKTYAEILEDVGIERLSEAAPKFAENDFEILNVLIGEFITFDKPTGKDKRLAQDAKLTLDGIEREQDVGLKTPRRIAKDTSQLLQKILDGVIKSPKAPSSDKKNAKRLKTIVAKAT